MEGEQGGGERRARQAESCKQPPQKEGRSGMEKDVDEVVTEWLEGPEVLLDPERGEDHRVVLLVGFRLGPDEAQPFDPVEGPVLREVRVVVPDEARPEGRQIGCRHGEDKRGSSAEEGPLRHAVRIRPLGVPQRESRCMSIRPCWWKAPIRGTKRPMTNR